MAKGGPVLTLRVCRRMIPAFLLAVCLTAALSVSCGTDPVPAAESVPADPSAVSQASATADPDPAVTPESGEEPSGAAASANESVPGPVIPSGEEPPEPVSPEQTDEPDNPETSADKPSVPSEEPDPVSVPAHGIKTVTFVSVNDLHGHIEQDASGRNGIANTALGIDRLSAFYDDRDPDTDVRDDLVLFANGDMFQGTAVSNRSNGLAVLMAMNMMRFDAMGIGNHEFDWMLETVLPYWDGDRANGEADFPLLSANIERISAGKRLADLSDKDNIADGIIVRKMGIRIGLVSCIGPLKGSILASAVADYEFTDVTQAVERVATRLKREGADLICVSIHDGDAGGVEHYDVNREIALLKGPDGHYLADVIFNGHTHTMQKGEIVRPGGTPVPVVQAGANNQGYGYVRMTFDPDTGETRVDACGTLSVADMRAQCDPEISEAVRRYAEDLAAEDGVLATSGVRLNSRNDYADYVGEIMLKAFGADFSIGNYGGLRSTAGITGGTEITLSHVYEMIPFDNKVYVVTIPGSALYDFYYANESYYYLGESGDVPRLAGLKNSTNLYTLAIIDYVYTGSYFNRARQAVRSEVNTGLVLRDLLAEDLRCYGRDSVLWSPRKGPRLEQQYFPG